MRALEALASNGDPIEFLLTVWRRAEVMIVSSRCSLSIYSDVRTAAEIAEILGVEPTRANEKGEPTRAGLAGRDLEERHLVHQRSHWAYDADQSMIDPCDRTGFGSLRVLLNIFKDRADALTNLRPDCETVIWWSGDSDSSQGGFVLPADLIADLAILGCDLFGMAYPDDPVEVSEEVRRTGALLPAGPSGLALVAYWVACPSTSRSFLRYSYRR